MFSGSQMSLTVAELAEIVRRPEVDRAAVVERLRTFTDLGLLETVGPLNIGTGKRRQYPDEAIYSAAIFDTLADGFHVGELRHFTVVKYAAVRARLAWFKQRQPGLFLEVDDFGKPNHQGGRHAVFLHQPGRKPPHLGKLIHPRARFAIIVNVSDLFMRIERQRNELEAAKAEPPAEVEQQPLQRAKRRAVVV
jgi:hypothetical protein